MVELQRPELAGERLRYSGDTWELTGAIDVRRNGELIDVEVRKADRVRRKAGVLTFTLRDPPASINPGNPGQFGVEIKRIEDRPYLVVTRNHATSHYRISNLRYA